MALAPFHLLVPIEAARATTLRGLDRYRKTGVTSALIAAALKAAKRAGAVALEAYPVDANKTPSAERPGNKYFRIIELLHG